MYTVGGTKGEKKEDGGCFHIRFLYVEFVVKVDRKNMKLATRINKITLIQNVQSFKCFMGEMGQITRVLLGSF